MFIPVRFRLIAAFAITAVCAVNTWAQSPQPTMTPTQIAEWAKGLPPGTEIEFESTSTNEQAKGEGASLDASGDAVNTKVDSGAPNSKLSGGGGASGGKLQSDTTAEQLAFNWLPILTWLAAAAAGAFAFLAYQRGQIKQATSLGVLSGGLAAVAFFPALLPIGLGAGVLWLVVQSGALSKFVAAQRSEVDKTSLEAMSAEGQASENFEALRAVAAGVSDLKDVDPVAYAKVTELISRHADENDKATIKTVRRQDDLH